VGGQLPMTFISLVAGMPLAQSGRARALGVSSLRRHPGFPEVPTIAEAGVPDFEFYLWQGVIGPAALPRALVTRVNGEINNALADPQVKERLIQAGNELVGGTPERAADYIRSEVERWKKTIKPEMRIHR
jgi:tripartite-type tricarboxylate transporter receptor subunit TctC